MLETLKFGGGNWANKTDSTLAYSDQYGNYKPLPFDFTRASSATVVNKEGLIETVQSGTPRIDFSDNTNGALLLEPQRTNLLLQSNQFDTTWSTSNVNLTSGQGGIGGSSNAWLYTITDPTHHLSQNVSSATTNVFSIYAKANSADGIVLRLVGAPNNPYIFYSLLDGTYVGNGGGGGINPSSQPVVNMGNGWYRFQISATGLTQVYIYGGTSLGTFAPNGSIYIQNSQLEVGSYATSIIPTQGSTVTRVAELCSGAGNDQVINSTEGVLYAEISALDNPTSQEIALSVSEGQSGANRLLIRMKTNGAIGIVLRVANTTEAAIDSGVLNQLANHKVAVKWKVNDIALWIDGVEVGTDNLANVFPVNTLDEFSFNQGNNSNQFYGNTKDVRVYNTALTDGELATLTTL
jgi:hypothetical protein